ncbi:MAG: excinuclease ABC subunit A, partial [Myxococcota bacterium]
LDEPTIGLHPRDTGRLIEALRSLLRQGNSVVVVEHDADMIRCADHILDIGPTGGRDGGYLVAKGSPKSIEADPSSVTGPWLGAVHPSSPPMPIDANHPCIELFGASQHNLKEVDLRVPVGRLVVVAGVSGSGKSTLIRTVLLRALRQELGLVNEEPPGSYRSILHADLVRRAVEIDQSPIGRTPRSVPATYLGIWDVIRKLYAATPDARARGYGPSRFSFNVKEGRCAVCEGAGVIRAEMAFLPDVLTPCESCQGQRLSKETLEVRLFGYSAGELLDLDAGSASELFQNIPQVHRALELMDALGLGYLKLGQASNTLSGGEAQRLKLTAELSSVRSAGSLFVLDEPTTGLHLGDVHRLLPVLRRFVSRGDSLVVVEHHPDVIRAADWVVELGPEAGDEGGAIVAAGTPADLMRGDTLIGQALRSA